jgi:polyribonucleotide nucleotidyltransferase
VSITSVTGSVGGKSVTLATGKLAGQADGAVTVRLADTEVLVTATASRSIREGIDFFPLTVDVEERMYAAGKIPGSFFRREGRPTEKAILTARLIDRPLRPSFRDGYRCETQVISTVLSVDQENPYDILSLNGASAALTISPIPFQGPVGGVRLALKDGEWIPLPTFAELDESVFELVVAGRRNEKGEIDIMMVEAGSTEDGLRLIEAGQPASDEASVAAGLDLARTFIGEFIDLQLELRGKVEIPEVEWPVVVDYSPEVYERVETAAGTRVGEVIAIQAKKERSEAQAALETDVLARLTTDETDPAEVKAVGKAFRSLVKSMMRRRVVEEGIRLDGRGPRDIRPLSAEVGLIPRAHGSGLFQRGETQVLNVTTLGMLRMEQLLDTLDLEESKRYMHHYNFPPFSTGETGFMRGPKRREIGHGALAEKAVLPVVPTADEFPYALRLVSEVLSSNGSTSMASVCSSTLSLMDAGVPISEPVAGIAMGLIAHDGGFVTLTDILGADDALGDMDFKVAGTAGVITALQLDTKIEGLPSSVLAEALGQAREARLAILEVMTAAIGTPRPELTRWAPRIEAVQIPRDKIGEIIGPKGKMIRQIEEETGATLEIEDDGTVRIGAVDGESMAKARDYVLAIAFPPEPEIGKEYEGEVVNITKFGAFVNILPGRDGLLHISKIGGGRRIESVEEVLNLGDKVQVVVRDIDRGGNVSLDMAGAEVPAEGEPRPEREQPSDRGGRDRDRDRGGPRDRDRGGRGGRERDRGGRDRGRDRDRGGDRPKEAGTPGGRRTVVSFEDEFERGL